MPPRHAYWTIIVDDQPTAFRAHDHEDLLAILNRLKEKHPSAVMKWFERGRLWDSRDAAREQGFGRGERRWEGPRPDDKPRDRSWRPGGDHRDPRQPYKDAKKAKWERFKKKIRNRADRDRPARSGGDEPQKFSPPHGDPLRDQIDRARARNFRDKRDHRRDRDRAGYDNFERSPSRPHGDKMRAKTRPFGKASTPDRRGGWKPKGPPWRDHPRDQRPGDWRENEWRARPADRPRPPKAFRKAGDRPQSSSKSGGAKRQRPRATGGGRPPYQPHGPRGPRDSRPPRKRRDDE